jgi:hypothetical protein
MNHFPAQWNKCRQWEGSCHSCTCFRVDWSLEVGLWVAQSCPVSLREGRPARFSDRVPSAPSPQNTDHPDKSAPSLDTSRLHTDLRHTHRSGILVSHHMLFLDIPHLLRMSPGSTLLLLHSSFLHKGFPHTAHPRKPAKVYRPRHHTSADNFHLGKMSLFHI